MLCKRWIYCVVSPETGVFIPLYSAQAETLRLAALARFQVFLLFLALLISRAPYRDGVNWTIYYLRLTCRPALQVHIGVLGATTGVFIPLYGAQTTTLRPYQIRIYPDEDAHGFAPTYYKNFVLRFYTCASYLISAHHAPTVTCGTKTNPAKIQPITLSKSLIMRTYQT